MKPALIALEDGTIFEARAFAGEGNVTGELVFNTSMTGYQEVLTDPSYHGQIVTMTYPLIGNYGVNEKDMESAKPHASAMIVGECSRRVSNWRSERTLADLMVENGVLGLHHVDTRAITLHIRSKGAMRCIVSTTEFNRDALVEKARASQGLAGRDLAGEVSTPERYKLGEDNTGPKVAVIDCGCKRNILRLLEQRGCQLEVFPISSSADDILATQPDGFFISNGPGDPAAVPYAVKEIKKIIKTAIPTFGICFGHQLLALAIGGTTYKLKFGHRGANQPVKDLLTNTIAITSQNHGFCVSSESLDQDLVETTHINLNDGTSEGLRHKKLPINSVQYHPEANPGPHDAEYLFDQFVNSLKGQNA